MVRVNGLRNAATAAGLIIALTTVPSSRAAAQVTAAASIDAIALVLGFAPLTASGVNDLQFGSVIAGLVGTIADEAADGGRWDVSGEPGASVSLTFTLPTVLTGPGGDIPISFGASDGLIWDPFPTTFTTFNPNAVSVTTIIDNSGFPDDGTLTVGIIGSVAPALGTTTGTYTGTITLTVAYI
ncbi:MAG: hypothetical protein HY337_07340 [Gemmatimonadetes bacterium]|nr:hypothetical protein [Gemmatimonadota bacterium]